MDFNRELEKYKDEMISNTQKLIAIRSVKDNAGIEGAPFGRGVSRALDFCLDLAASLGFVTKNLDGYCGYAEYGEGMSYICAITHLDTIEEGTSWTHDPLGGEIEDGKIYGRGAIDDKGPAVSLIYALKALSDSNASPGRKIRLIFGTDEEGSSGDESLYRDIKHYLQREIPPLMGFTIEANFPAVYAEKGLSFIKFSRKIMQPADERIEYIHGGEQPNSVPSKCVAKLITADRSGIISKLRVYAKENMCELTASLAEDGVIIEASGSEVFSGNLEYGTNAITMMLRFLAQLEFGGSEMNDALKFLVDSIGRGINGEGLGIVYEDEFSGKLTHNLGILNFDGRFISMDMDFRYPVTCDFDNSSAIIKRSFESAGFEVKICNNLPPIYYPRDHFAIKPLVAAYRSITGDDSEPIAIGGSSYAKAMANIVAFGPIFPGGKETEHTVGEYVEIDDLVLMGKVYAKALYDLSHS